jgi:hypothetical protein
MAKRRRTQGSRARTAKRRGTPARKPRAAARTGHGTDAAWRDLTVRTPAGEFPLVISASLDAWQRDFQRAAMQWTYILRNRERWSTLPEAAKEQGERARRLLLRLGITPGCLDAVAAEGSAEVVVPYLTEEEAWEARIFPWEYLLAAATREQRAGRPLTIVRCLAVRTPPPARVPKKVLYVESAPGQLNDLYEFDAEREIVRSSLKLTQWEELKNPTLTQLRATVARFKPDIVHLAGFDSHQGLLLLDGDADAAADDGEPREPDAAQQALDGYLLTGEDGRPAAVDARRLALALCPPGERGPVLVACNLQNSAARTAPQLLAHGAAAAIGMQDVFDDNACELFFANFYRAWRHTKWDLAESFRQAWESVRAADLPVRGSGLVLWSAHRLVSKRVRTKPLEAGPLWIPDGVPPQEVSQFVRCEPLPVAELNYSLLHNRQPLFDHFRLINVSNGRDPKDRLGTIAGLDVTVTLSAGPEVAKYQTRIDLSKPNDDVKGRIHVPLTSELMRSDHESINSSLFVEVLWGKHVLHRDSTQVRLLPVDQWRDNDQDGQWLPSFVLPRDPAVGALIDKAQRYVRVLRDDPSAGFDGYQSIDPQAAEPDAEVDRQVQAVWSMIVHELGLGYVNPPPTYSSALDSQRLRTPSMVVRDRCGTCIDLSLLFAACLELVDIYPVIFLLDGHAFPGYWRSSAYHQQFIKMTDGRDGDDSPGEVIATEDKDKTRVAGAQRVPWWSRKYAYDEIAKRVRQGHLVPLETVWLTEHSGFWDAVVGGRDNLKSRRTFHSMLDIVRAREAGVTPLPIGGPA